MEMFWLIFSTLMLHCRNSSQVTGREKAEAPKIKLPQVLHTCLAVICYSIDAHKKKKKTCRTFEMERNEVN